MIGEVHHVELWVPDLGRAVESWGWLLGELGHEPYQDWPGGRSWRRGTTYVVVEQSSALTAQEHDRCRPGLNHLAFHAGAPGRVEDLVARAGEHGWTLMYGDRHPRAGGRDTHTAHLHDRDGYQVELVAELSR